MTAPKINQARQIARVAAAQGLTRYEAADQVLSRVFAARAYLMARAARH